MFGYSSPRYGAWSLDPYGAPTATGIAMGLAQGIGNLQGTFAQNQARNLQNQITQGTMPGLISAQNAQNEAKTDTAVPGALANLKLAQFHANYPLTTLPGMAGQAGAIQYLRDSSGNVRAVPVNAPITSAMPQTAPTSNGLINSPVVPVASPVQGNSTPISWQNGTPSVTASPIATPLSVVNGLIGASQNLNMTPISFQPNNAPAAQIANAPLIQNAAPAAAPLIAPNVKDQYSNANLTGMLGSGMLLGQQAQLANIGWKNALTQSMANRYSPTLTKLQVQEQLQNQGYTPAEAQAIANNSQQAVNVTTNGIAPTPTGNVQQDQINQQNAAQSATETGSAIQKQTTTVDTQKRLAAAARVDPLLDQMKQLAPQALQYASIAGKSQQLAAQLAQQNDPRYLAYKQYKQVQAAAQPDAAMAIGVHPTDKGFEEFSPMFNIDTWDVTPQESNALLDNAIRTIRTEGGVNTQNLAQNKSTVLANPPSSNNQTANQDMVRIQAPNGRIILAPSADVDKLIAAGGKRA